MVPIETSSGQNGPKTTKNSKRLAAPSILDPCDLTDVPASIYDRKIDARPFDTTLDIYDVSLSCNRFPKTEIRQFGASGTDELKHMVTNVAVRNPQHSPKFFLEILKNS